jgi:hypothetical protein
MGVYLLAILIGVTLRVQFPDTDHKPSVVYTTYKDLIPFLIAIPAAWLGFCFQRRSSYVQQLRTFWATLVEAIQRAVQYTHLAHPELEDYAGVMSKLSTIIDELRGTFRNRGERRGQVGIYPFESLKQIPDVIDSLGHSKDISFEKRQEARNTILALWRRSYRQLLREFDRDTATYLDSPYVISDEPEKKA